MADSIKTYTVVTDSHGYPFALRGADFDLGDNTEANSNLESDTLHLTGALHMTLNGNHDVFVRKANNSQYQKYEDVFVLNGTTYRIVFYGLDTSYYDPEKGWNGLNQRCNYIQDSQITDMTNDLRTKANSGQLWYVIVLTHIPLFETTKEPSWPEKCPDNYEKVINTLVNYRDGKSAEGFPGGGVVLGCFCGHTHSNIRVTSEHIYMEALYATGGLSSTSVKTPLSDGGLYNRQYDTITINFTKHTINGTTYDSPTISPASITYNGLTNCRKNQTSGMFKLNASSSSYPKFTFDGKYLGYSSSPAGGCDYNLFSAWGVNTTIYSGNISVSATKVLFSPAGLLSSYCDSSGTYNYIPSYSTSSVHFVANGKRWEFQNGLYIFDKSKAYKLNNDSNYYPGFDADGRYLGWSDGANQLLTGARDSTTSSRSFQLVSSGTTRLYVNKVHVAAVVNIIFGEDGLLTSFERNTGTYYTNVSGQVEIIGGSAKWTFNNKLLTNIEEGGKIWAYHNGSNELMTFTNTPYYMYFTNGYLTGYRNQSDASTTVITTGIDDNWTCRKTVKYYTDEVSAYYNATPSATETPSYLTYLSTDGTNHYISNLNNSYSFARIDVGSAKYFFRKISASKWILVDIYGG